MVTAIPAARLAVIAYLCVLGSCSCSNGTVEGILGESVMLSCMSTSCGSLYWRNDSMGDTSPFVEPSRRTTVHINGDSNELHIFNMSPYDVGSYSCWCNENNDAARRICSDSLELICQAKLILNNASKLHKSSRTDSFPEVTINASVEDRLKVKCPEDAISTTDCYNVRKRESAQFTYRFKISPERHSCLILCQAKKKAIVFCSITFAIKVSIPVDKIDFTPFASESITLAPGQTTMKVDNRKDDNVNSVTDKHTSFFLIIGVCILAFIIVLVAFVASFCIFSLRLESRSQSTPNVDVVNLPTYAYIPIVNSYEIVNKYSKWIVKGNDHPNEPEFLNSDGFYSEIDDAGKKYSSTHQPNYQKTGILTKTDHYSEVTRSDTKVIKNDHYSEVTRSDNKVKTIENGQETDRTMYSEVNKGENQPSQKECTSSPQSFGDNPSVSNVHIHQVLEEPKRSDYNVVHDASTSQILYTLVNTDTYIETGPKIMEREGI